MVTTGTAVVNSYDLLAQFVMQGPGMRHLAKMAPIIYFLDSDASRHVDLFRNQNMHTGGSV